MTTRSLPSGETGIDSTELNSGEFSLVFEGSIDTTQTLKILKELQKFKVQAYFMIPGDNGRNHSQVVKALVQAGQALGSQSTEDEDMTLIPTEEANKKLLEGAKSLARLTGRRSRLFSFPLAEEDIALSPLQDFTHSQGMTQVMPNLDSEDWKTVDPQVLARNVQSLTSRSNKGIILLHSRLEQTALALPLILKGISDQHRTLVILR